MTDILEWRKRPRCSDEDKDKDDKPDKKKKSFPWNGSSDNLSVSSSNNHIYFYASVTKKSCLSLNMELKKVASKLMSDNFNFRD